MYTVIARKYRPQTFSEVVNQEHIKTTLRNAIEGGRLAHGYIFSGSRGTGKTTMARLLAKSLNCSGIRPTGSPHSQIEPCGVCSSCTEIAGGSPVDVIEIDAASNRGIDDIRSLRENARYAPARDPYKFFIVDEAHQLTKEAWNALLKTLEEPPPNVIFVFCTTEAHAIPQTIVSRCQTFAFHNLGFEETIKQLEHICQSEGIEATEEALSVITQAGEGSLRDSLSTLDQAIACCGAKLDGQTVRQLLGVVTTAALDEVVAAIIAQSPERMLALVDSLVREGQNLRNFVSQLTRHFRNLLVIKTAPKSPQLVEAPRKEQERLADVAATFSEEDLTRYLQIALKLYSDLHQSPQPRFHTELGLLKMIHAGRLTSIEEMIGRVNSGAGVAAGPSAAALPPGPAPATLPTLATPRLSQMTPPGGVSIRTLAQLEQTRRQSDPAVRPKEPAEFQSQIMAKVNGMLEIKIERVIAWELADDSVTAYYPAGTASVNMPSSEEHRTLANLSSEILGKPVSFRASSMKADAQPPAGTVRTATATASAGPAPNLTEVGALGDLPELADYLRHFPGARVEEQKRRG